MPSMIVADKKALTLVRLDKRKKGRQAGTSRKR